MSARPLEPKCERSAKKELPGGWGGRNRPAGGEFCVHRAVSEGAFYVHKVVSALPAAEICVPCDESAASGGATMREGSSRDVALFNYI